MNPVTDKKPPKRVYRIVDVPGDKRHPFALLDSADTSIRVGATTRELANYAFDSGLADEVRHDEDLIAQVQR